MTALFIICAFMTFLMGIFPLTVLFLFLAWVSNK